jgi:hypothetical protein
LNSIEITYQLDLFCQPIWAKWAYHAEDQKSKKKEKVDVGCGG